MNIGAGIKKLREYRDWQQNKLAEKAGISQTHLSKIERSEIDTPHLSTLTDLYDALGVNPDRLIKRVLDDVEPNEFLELCKEDSQFK